MHKGLTQQDFEALIQLFFFMLFSSKMLQETTKP